MLNADDPLWRNMFTSTLLNENYLKSDADTTCLYVCLCSANSYECDQPSPPASPQLSFEVSSLYFVNNKLHTMVHTQSTMCAEYYIGINVYTYVHMHLCTALGNLFTLWGWRRIFLLLNCRQQFFKMTCFQIFSLIYIQYICKYVCICQYIPFTHSTHLSSH